MAVITTFESVADFSTWTTAIYDADADINLYTSTVIDTQRTDSLLSSLLVSFEAAPNLVAFSFRASNVLFSENDTVIAWSGFTAPDQLQENVLADSIVLGVFIKGRYHQVRVKLSPFTTAVDSVGSVLKKIEINTSTSHELLAASNHAFEPETILGQIVKFDDEKNIHKATLNLSITSTDRKNFVVGKAETLSFQAANFQIGRDEWAFQPVIHWVAGNSWITSGTTIRNTLQMESYDDEDDAILNAPSLTYKLFFPESGTYHMWGYGYIDGGGIFWSMDDDVMDLRKMTLGLEVSGWQELPRWTKFGTFFLEEGGLHEFTVYLSRLNITILDQWYFTKNTAFEVEVDAIEDSITTPLPLSEGPFNTALRLRSLDNNKLSSLESPPSGNISITSWLPSQNIAASGKFNYEIREALINSGVTFSDGLSMEYWQIGGNRKNFAAWDYSFPVLSIGSSFRSANFGETIEFL